MTAKQQFDEWRLHFNRAFQGYERLDMQMTARVAKDMEALWEENQRLQSRLALLEQSVQPPPEEDLRQLRSSVDGSITASW